MGRLHGNQDAGPHHGPRRRHGNRPDAPCGYRGYDGSHGNPARTEPAVSRTNRGAASPWRPELCYTPANHIPLTDYVSVEGEELFLYSPPPSPSDSQSEAGGPDGDGQSPAFFYGPARSQRAPSPLYEADAPFTILSAMETSEPFTAVFLGFQTTQDESGRGQEYEGSLEAELVMIDDANDASGASGASGAVEGGGGYPAGIASNQALRPDDKRRTSGSRKQNKACCTVC